MSAQPDASNPTGAVADSRPLVFISHRHDDKPLADAVARFVSGASGGRVAVYQSSDAKSEGPRAGGYLAEQLASALWRAGLVVLVYTRHDADWSWCTFECGLALHPESPDTRLKVFTCGNEGPPQFQGRVLVKVTDRGDVQRFANDFLTDPGFFPGSNEPVTHFQPNDSNVLDAANRLFDALDAVELPAGEVVEHWPAYPFLQLQIEADERERLCADATQTERLGAARAVARAAQITDSDSEGARIFGRRDITIGTPFDSLIREWSATFSDDAPRWLDALALQLIKAAQWSWPNLRWELMNSIDERDSTLYAPVLTRIRRWPSMRMQFDVTFTPFGLTSDRAHVDVGLPHASGAAPPGGDEAA